jgi:hypothetical protein
MTKSIKQDDTNKQPVWLTDPKAVKTNLWGAALIGIALAPLTGGVSLMYAGAHVALSAAAAADNNAL